MKKQIAVLSVLLALWGNGAWAGGSTGGGYGVVCEDVLTKTFTVRLLDYYEADLLLPQLKLDLGKGNTETELAEFVTARLSALDPDRAKDYQRKAHAFLGDTRFVNAAVPEIKDYGFATLEDGCVLKQIAVQNLVPIPEGKKFTVNKTLWDKLSMIDRAGLILHEIIYEEALALGQKDSRNSRYYNALISSRQVRDLTPKEYSTRLAAVGLPETPGSAVLPSLSIPTMTATAKEGAVFQFDLARYVVSSSANPLTFTFVSGPSWLVVTASGKVMGTPTAANAGANALTVGVTDGKARATGMLTVTVIRDVGKQMPTAYVSEPYAFDLQNQWPFEMKCRARRASLISGPAWMAHGAAGAETELTGTPSRSDLGKFTAIVELEQSCDRPIDDYSPDGTVKRRKVTETQYTRVQYEGLVALRTTAPCTAAAADFDEVVEMESRPRAICQGVIVGPHTVLTAGNCWNNGQKVAFKFHGKDYEATITRHPLFPAEDINIALGYVKTEITEAEPLNIGGTTAKGEKVQVLAHRTGYADRDLVSYTHTVQSVDRDQILHGEQTGMQSISFGNSGAPVIVGRRNKTVVAIVTMSNMSSPETVYSKKLGVDLVQRFFKKFAADNLTDICGVTTQCR